MAIAFDPAKAAANIAKHGVSLARGDDLDIIVQVEDGRRDYGEPRYRLYGEIDGVAHCLVVTYRDGDTRAISLRRARAKEMKRHAP